LNQTYCRCTIQCPNYRITPSGKHTKKLWKITTFNGQIIYKWAIFNRDVSFPEGNNYPNIGEQVYLYPNIWIYDTELNIFSVIAGNIQIGIQIISSIKVDTEFHNISPEHVYTILHFSTCCLKVALDWQRSTNTPTKPGEHINIKNGELPGILFVANCPKK